MTRAKALKTLGWLALAGAVYWVFFRPPLSFRYRLTVEIEADGKVHSASSVIKVVYRWTTFSSGGRGWGARVEAGIGPIVELGRHGTVVVARLEVGNDRRFGIARERLYKQEERHSGYAGIPIPLAALPDVTYDLRPPNIARARGKVVVTKWLPNFVWLPPHNNWADAMQLFEREFETFIGPGVRLKRILVEPAPYRWTMQIPNPPPAALITLCSSTYLKLFKIRRMADAPPLIHPMHIGIKHTYFPYEVKTVCDYM
ncbi:MAG: hypothetical protein AB7E70_19840 [Hyphomicrobiaceae bacterium]|uniref:hypothetical protein n=1 Tax=Bradyrhizobium sp. TaxID=376 RepID=UPI003D108705